MHINTKTIVLGLISVYFIAQVILPKIGLSLVLNFDTSCYSGSISFIERANTGNSSCGANGNFIGFPFVINFDYNTAFQKLITAMLDFLPIGIALVILKVLKRNKPKSGS